MRRTVHKFNAQRTTVDGITFASKAEARRYGELKLLEKAGEIECLALQPKFPLYAVGPDDRAYLVGHYVADFSYYDMTTGALVVSDVKGMKTPLYRWKQKHFEKQYGMAITEVGRRAVATRSAKAKHAGATAARGISPK